MAMLLFLVDIITHCSALVASSLKSVIREPTPAKHDAIDCTITNTAGAGDCAREKCVFGAVDPDTSVIVLYFASPTCI